TLRSRDVGWFAGDVRFFDADGRIVLEADDVRFARTERTVPMERSLFELDWVPRPLASNDVPSGAGARGRWLIVTDDGSVGDAVAGKLADLGGECVCVPPAPLDALRARVLDDAGWRGVLYVAAPDDAVAPGGTPDGSGDSCEPQRAVERRCGTAVALVQALDASSGPSRPRLWLVTRNAQSLGPEQRVHPDQAPLWGLGRSIALEHPELRCTLVDLPASDLPAAGDDRTVGDDAGDSLRGADSSGDEALVAELLADDGETQVAYRGGARLAARLHRRPPERALASVPPEFDGNGTYLITGGLGALGLAVAEWMARAGAGALALVGRRRPTRDAERRITALQSAGCRVQTFAADVTRPADLESVMAAIDGTMPPLRGVIHGAGIMEDMTLARMNARQLADVLAPKVAGAFHLHRSTRSRALDFFVLFSSASAVLGAPGQANYAAANAYLDALAHRRRAQGLPALSINWSAWAQVGLAAAQENRAARLAASGLLGLDTAQGLAALGALLGASS
ncbi:MAG: SDR family oxidoreductase, partial [Chloroflexota bacterium]